MELMFGIAIITIVTAYALKTSVTDATYALRGKTSPRMDMKMRQLEAAAANAGRPVRYGRGGYLADLIDDAWSKAWQHREQKLAAAKPESKPQGPMRQYFGTVWGDRWNLLTRKHDVRHRDRLVKQGLADPDDPLPDRSATAKTKPDAPKDKTGASKKSSPGTGPSSTSTAKPSPSNSHSVVHDSNRYNVGGEAGKNFKLNLDGDDVGYFKLGDIEDGIRSRIGSTNPNGSAHDTSPPPSPDAHTAGSAGTASASGQQPKKDSLSPDTQDDNVVALDRHRHNKVLNRKGQTMAEAELYGLESTLAWAHDNIEESQNMKNDLDAAQASLQSGGVTGTAIDLIGQLSDAYDSIVEASKALEEELSKQTTVADAYQAVDGAGTREFVTS